MRLLALAFGFLWFFQIKAQGTYIDFGQNRIQYKNFKWQKLSTSSINVLYYDSNYFLANELISIANASVENFEKFLNYNYSQNIDVILFENLNDYRQSNIGFINTQYNSGGYAHLPNDVAIAYFNGNYNYLKTQVQFGIAEIILREMLFGTTFRERIQNTTGNDLPKWFTKGLASYLSNNWSAQYENQIRSIYLTNAAINFNEMDDELQQIIGHSLWQYIVQKYSSSSVNQLLYIARFSGNIDAAFEFLTKQKTSALIKEWWNYTGNKITNEAHLDFPKGKTKTTPKIFNKKNTCMQLNSDGSEIAFVTNNEGKFTVWLYNLSTSKNTAIFSGGVKSSNQLPDYSFPVLQWIPNKNQLLLLTYLHNEYQLLKYKDKKWTPVYRFKNFQSVNDFNLNEDGNTIVFSATKNNQSDIFTLNLQNKQLTQLTQDIFFDSKPVFSGNTIIFKSNNNIEFNRYSTSESIFFIDALKNVKKIQLAENFQSIQNFVLYNDSILGFTADYNGLQNAFATKLKDSALPVPQTNYAYNIAHQSISYNGAVLAELIEQGNQFNLFISQSEIAPLNVKVTLKTLEWKKNYLPADSLYSESNLRKTRTLPTDSVFQMKRDTNSVAYEFQSDFTEIDFKDSLKNILKEREIPIVSKYKYPLNINFLMTQIDISQLGNYLYAPTVPFEFYRVKNISPLLKINASDITRSYLFEGGLRVSGDFKNSDVFLKGYLNKQRFDHEIFFNRRVKKFDFRNKYSYANVSNQLQYNYIMPHSINIKTLAGITIRQEKNIQKATEINSFNRLDTNFIYTGIRFESIFDNTTANQILTKLGLQCKLGIEFQKKINTQGWMNYLHAELRYRKKLLKSIVLAQRISGSYSFGKRHIMYYLGGTENWLSQNQWANNLERVKDYSVNYYSAVSGLRGFQRGIRYGYSYLLSNTELRIPVLQLLNKRYIRNEFLRNILAVGFVDAGTAFVGKTAANPANPYNTVYVNSPNYTLSVTANRNPFVVGYGLGLRTKFLGYFVRYDYATGITENTRTKAINYFSIGLDF